MALPLLWACGREGRDSSGPVGSVAGGLPTPPSPLRSGEDLAHSCLYVNREAVRRDLAAVLSDEVSVAEGEEVA